MVELFLGAGVVLLLVLLVVVDRLSLGFLRPARREISTRPGDLGLEAEEITVDGDVKLRAWLMDPPSVEPDAPVVLLVHGWGANSSGPLQLAPALLSAGMTVVAVDVRGHGRSDAGPYVTLRHFRDDVVRTLEILTRRYPDRQLLMVGHSMGGAAGVLAAAEGAPLERLVTIAAPHDVYDATRRFLRKRGIPPAPVIALFRLSWRRRIGVPYPRIHPGGRAPDVSIPTLVIQPENDRQVPPEEGEKLAAALGVEAKRVDAGHSSVLEDPGVHETVVRFLRGATPIDPGTLAPE